MPFTDALRAHVKPCLDLRERLEVTHSTTWLNLWAERTAREPPAGTLNFEHWATVYTAVRALEHLRSLNVPATQGVTESDDAREMLEAFQTALHHAALVCNVIGLGGLGRHRVRRWFRRTWRRVRPLKPITEEELMRRVTEYAGRPPRL